VVFALIAELVEIDGEKIVYEDLLAMDLNDVLALQSEVRAQIFRALRRRLRGPRSLRIRSRGVGGDGLQRA